MNPLRTFCLPKRMVAIAPAARRPSTAPSGRIGMGTTLLLALMIAGLAGAGWFIANQQQMLAVEQDRLNDANKRLAVLEQRLSATDTAMSQEGQDTKQQINLWESEIRKLWAIANERNKDWIKENQARLKTLSATLNGIRATNRDLKAATGRHEEALKIQQQVIDQVTSLELQLQQMLRSQRELVDKTNVASQNLAKIEASLSPQVSENSRLCWPLTRSGSRQTSDWWRWSANWQGCKRPSPRRPKLPRQSI